MQFEELMNYHRDNRDNFELLKGQYEMGRLVPFIGAGLSIPPYSGWGQTLKNICQVVPNAVDELDSLLKENKYEEAAQHVYEKLGRRRFNNAFKRELSSEKIQVHGLSKAMLLLPKLFNGPVFTTNFDHCIEEAYHDFRYVIYLKNKENDAALIGQTFRDQPHFLYKLHGDLESGRVITQNEYDELYKVGGPFEIVLRNFFAYKKFLFLGCSLTGTDRYMQIIDQVTEYESDNYAILPTLERQEEESDEKYQKRQDEWETMLSNHNITPVFYPSGDYDSVIELLSALNPFHEDHNDKRVNHNTGFFGRDNDVKEIEKRLFNYRYVFVHGEGGIGKTQVCEEVVSRFDGEVAKVYLQGSTGYTSLVSSIAKRLGINENNKGVDKLLYDIKKELRRKAKKKQFLLYLDNFEDVMKIETMTDNVDNGVTQPDPAVKLVIDLIEETPQSLFILISTRDYILGATNYELPVLEDEEIIILFQKEFLRVGGSNHIIERDSNALVKLVKELIGGVPLAAILAASQAVINGSIEVTYNEWKAGKYITQGIAPDSNMAHTALKTAYFVSYRHLADNYAAKKLWGYLALVPKGISRKLGEMLLPGIYIDSSQKLKQLSLARLDDNNNLFMLAPVKQQAFVYDTSIRSNCIEALTEQYCKLIRHNKENSDLWKIAVDNVDDIIYFWDYLANDFEGNTIHLKSLLKDTIDLRYLSLWRPFDSLGTYNKMIDNKEFFDSCDNTMRGDIFLGRGKVFYLLGCEDESINDYNTAKDYFVKAKNFKRVAITNSAIGNVEGNKGHCTEAIEFFKKAQSYFESVNDMVYLGDCKCDIGEMMFRRGKRSEGLKEMKEGLQLLKSNNAEQHRIANVSWSLGHALRRDNQTKEAMIYLEEARDIYSHEKDSLGLGNCYKDLAEICIKNHDEQKALNYYKKSLSFFEDSQVEKEYYDDIKPKINELLREIPKQYDPLTSSYDIDALIKRIDEKIAELEAELQQEATVTD